MSTQNVHLYFAHGDTQAQAWKEALWWMGTLAPCPVDCPCRA